MASTYWTINLPPTTSKWQASLTTIGRGSFGYPIDSTSIAPKQQFQNLHKGGRRHFRTLTLIKLLNEAENSLPDHLFISDDHNQEEEEKQSVENLKNRKAPGHDGIGNKSLKLLSKSDMSFMQHNQLHYF